jgi:hypothetical protein
MPTGITTGMVQFNSLPNIAIPILCPICGTTHTWKPSNSWIADSDRFYAGYPNGKKFLARTTVAVRH